MARIIPFASGRYAVGALFFASVCLAGGLPDHNHFQYWFPQGQDFFAGIVQDNCSAEFQWYRTGNRSAAVADLGSSVGVLTGGRTDALRDAVYKCILTNTPEDIKANMAAVGVFLGVFPTLLAILGSTTMETSALALLAQRPFLAVCLTLGSPVTNPVRPFDFPAVVDVLRSDDTSRRVPLILFKGPFARYVVSAIEYVVVAASIYNLAELGQQISMQTITSFWTGGTSGILIWAFSAWLIHVWGMICFRLRIRPTFPTSTQTWMERLRWELTPTYTHPAPEIDDTYRPGVMAHVTFLGLSLMTAGGIVAHIAWGTVIFSSLLFILTNDAVVVAFRLLASTIACQTILAYELAGLRHQYHEHRARLCKGGT